MLKITKLICAAVLLSQSLIAQENYNLQERSHLTFPGKTCANIWGYVDSLSNEYALVGTSTGLSIVDVTNPELPILRFNVDGVNDFWREVKTWQGFAYVTTEGNNGGLTIVDLRELPDTIYSQVYRGDGDIQNQLSTIHALHIDNGYAYIYGSNIGEGGAIFLDLTDPWNPTYAGIYDEKYVHDGIVFGDTLYASHVYDGIMGVIDVSDKLNPITINEQETPSSFTHNTWLTDDRNTVLTTDEVSNSYLTSYNIDNIDNIEELDRFQTSPGSGTIVHNTLVLNDFAVTSWYTEGVVIVDAHRPQNLIEVGKNDFSDFEGDGFNGCWGVYPYLPSGNIVASDIEEGLFVLTPNYIRASYLEGIVTDSSCGNLLEGVTVSIVELQIEEETGFNGIYRTGTVSPGFYTVSFSKTGYQTRTFDNIALNSGELTEINVSLFSDEIVALDGFVSDINAAALEDVLVSITNSTESFQLITNNEGEYIKCDLLPGEYSLAAGQWGYVTYCNSNLLVDAASNSPEITLLKGYYDDFQFNFGWSVSGTASSGDWVRVQPSETQFQGSISNPGVDAEADCNGFAFVTGNSSSGGAGATDVDNGSTILRSPWMDLSAYIDPYLSFSRWFFNGGGNDAVNDTLYIRLVEEGGNSVTLSRIFQDINSSTWFEEEYRIRDYINNPGMVRFEAEAVDFDNGHLVEAGIDLFSVIDSMGTVSIEEQNDLDLFVIYPNPLHSKDLLYYSLNEFNVFNKSAKISITDITGKLIYTEEIQSKQGQLNLVSGLKSGIYFALYDSGGGRVQTQRIVIIE
jgi:choice-of-anchor B domain-containing protein